MSDSETFLSSRPYFPTLVHGTSPGNCGGIKFCTQCAWDAGKDYEGGRVGRIVSGLIRVTGDADEQALFRTVLLSAGLKEVSK